MTFVFKGVLMIFMEKEIIFITCTLETELSDVRSIKGSNIEKNLRDNLLKLEII